MFDKFNGFHHVIYIIFVIIHCCVCEDEICDRQPFGTLRNVEPLAPDNQFYIEIDGINNDLYIPKREYKVTLKSRDDVSTFFAFTISIQADSIDNKNNPRKRIPLNPGRLEQIPNSTTTKSSYTCRNTIVQSDITAKTFVEALWTAPDKNNKCVTIFALVAVKPDMWYRSEGPLSKLLCEDTRKADDMQPMENNECKACEDARYQLTFQGMWSYNTHREMFPLEHDLGRFSDLVGASHSKDYNLYKYTSEASLGLKMLAEQGNTTKLELEIQERLGTTVRTIIKATAPPKPNMNTVTSFRASRRHHLVSLATGLLPSPDWFLGVANLELCDVETDDWSESITFNLYPMDAGTDKGLTFEAANEELSPPQPISPVIIPKNMKPFAKLRLDLIRTYNKPDCNMTSVVEQNTEDNGIVDGNDNVKTEVVNGGEGDTSVPQTTTSEPPPSVDPDSTLDCPMSTWEDWLPCEGECVDGNINGLQIRFRYHMIDGAVIGKYVEGGSLNEEKEVPHYCFKKYPTSETRECEDSCDENPEEERENAEEIQEDMEATPQRRVWWD